MDALGQARDRMVALGAAAALATAAVVSTPAVRHATDDLAPAVVHEVKALQVQLAAYNPFYPYALPTGPLGIAVTVPLSVATAVVLPVVDRATQLLTSVGVDQRLAQQPQLLARSLVVPVAVGVQVAVAGLLGGTYVFGQFTPIQALNFLIDQVKAAIAETVAAERALFGLPNPTATMISAGPSAQDVSATSIPDHATALTLSTAKVSAPVEAAPPKHTAPDTVKARESATGTAESATGTAESATATADDAATETPGDTETANLPAAAAPVVTKPTWKPPTLKVPTVKLPALKLPTLKLPTFTPSAPKKSTTGTATSHGATDSVGADTASSTPKAGAGSKDGGSEGSSK